MTSEDQLEKLFSGTTSIIGRLSRLDTYTRSITSETAGEVDAVTYLRSQLAPGAYIPPGGGWAAQYRTVSYIVAQILEEGVGGEVLELGGGVSTIWAGLALRKRGCGHLTSVDHDADYAEKTQQLVTRHGLADYVEVVHAPLVEQTVEGRTTSWYDLSRLPADLPPIGLLFVDGPPAADEPLAREPAFVMLRHRLRDDALVVLDDVDRPGEQEILEKWTAAVPAGVLLLIERIGRSAALRFTLSRQSDEPRPST